LLSESEWLRPRITQWLLEIETEFVVAHIHLTAGIWSSRNNHNLITPNVTWGTEQYKSVTHLGVLITTNTFFSEIPNPLTFMSTIEANYI